MEYFFLLFHLIVLRQIAVLGLLLFQVNECVWAGLFFYSRDALIIFFSILSVTDRKHRNYFPIIHNCQINKV